MLFELFTIIILIQFFLLNKTPISGNNIYITFDLLVCSYLFNIIFELEFVFLINYKVKSDTLL